MANEKQNRTKHIRLRLTPREYDMISTRWHRTTCRELSVYLRNILLNKPITVRHRNESLDDLIQALVLLRGELNFVGHNYNQVVIKLHRLRDFDNIGRWLVEHEAAWQVVDRKITEIKTVISNIDDKWLQS
jgi:hypothetical protein